MNKKIKLYTVLFLSAEFIATWLYFQFRLFPVALKMEDGNVSDFLSCLFKWLAIALSFMYIYLGNYIPVIRKNGQGFSCKWSDYNSNTKFKSSRYAGKVFFISGIISTLICICVNGFIGLGVMTATLVVALAVSCKKAKEYYFEEKENESHMAVQ